MHKLKLKRVIGRDRGSVLIIALGILAVLSILAVAITTSTTLEKFAATNYVDGTRALMVAESGFERAVAGLKSELLPRYWSYDPVRPAATLEDTANPSFAIGLFMGETFQDTGCGSGGEGNGKFDFVDNNGNNRHDKGEGDCEPYDDVNGNGRYDAYSGLVGRAVDSKGKPTVQGKKTAVMGTYAVNGDYYKIKLEDLSARLNVNMCLYNPTQVSKIIDYLCVALKYPKVGSALMAARNARPGNQFSTMDQVKEVLESCGLSDDQVSRLRTELTVTGYIADNVIKPKPALTEEALISLDSRFDPYGRRHNYTNKGYDVWEIDCMQTKGFELEDRAPVNINGASREMIQAIFTGIYGVYLKEGPLCNRGRGYYSMHNYDLFTYSEIDYAGTLVSASFVGSTGGFAVTGPEDPELVSLWGRAFSSSPIDDESIAYTLSRRVFDRTHDDDPLTNEKFDGQPFRSWEEFRDFIYLYTKRNVYLDKFFPLPSWYNRTTQATQAILDIYQADAIIANCNPNTDLNDYNASVLLYKTIDKADLYSYTTEFCLQSTGYFDVEVLGVVLGVDGSVFAQKRIIASMSLYRLYTETSQSQFMRDWAENHHNLSTMFSTNSLSYPTSSNLTIQSYPEPLVAAYIRDAKFDGYLQLANVQYPGRSGSLLFQASFYRDNPTGMNDRAVLYDGGDWPSTDADSAFTDSVGHKPLVVNRKPRDKSAWAPDRANAYKRMEPSTNKLMISKEDIEVSRGEVRTGSLYPEGAYSGLYRTIEYENPCPDINSTSGQSGGGYPFVQMWIRPFWDPYNSMRLRHFMELGCESPLDQFRSNGVTGSGSWDHHPHLIGFYPAGENPPGWCAALPENGSPSPADWPRRIICCGYNDGVWWKGIFSSEVTPNTDARCPKYDFDIHRWSSLGFGWPTCQAVGCSASENPRFLYLNGVNEDWHNRAHGYSGDQGYIRGQFMKLGGDMTVAFENYCADVTYDEVCMWSAKGAEECNNFYSQVWDDIYEKGRYYNGGDAAFTSSAIDLSAIGQTASSVILMSAYWTGYVPREFYKGYVNAYDHENPTHEFRHAIKGGKEILKPFTLEVSWDGGNTWSKELSNPRESVIRDIDEGRIFVAPGPNFKYRVHFNETRDLSIPIRESMLFDDFTIKFTTPDSPRITEWSVVNE